MSSAIASRVSVRGLTKIFHGASGAHTALDNVSIDIAPGEFVVLLGPSGCGKTTLLRCVGGLEEPDGGTIHVNGETVFSAKDGIMKPPEARRLSMVFQSYALWPHMTVAENIAYPLRNAGKAKPETGQRVGEVLAMVGLAAHAKAYPGQLSGGQQQRVALARAIAGNQDLVLFDEPLSNLDARVRERLRVELLALQRDIGFSALYVTHDQTEALALADRVAVMDVGRIAQVGSGKDIYSRPASRYVAQFVGNVNELPGTIAGAADGLWQVDTAFGRLAGVAEGWEPTAGAKVKLLFRPEACRDRRPTDGQAHNSLTGTVRRSMFIGPHVENLIGSGTETVSLIAIDSDPLPEGSAVTVHFDCARTRIFMDGS